MSGDASEAVLSAARERLRVATGDPAAGLVAQAHRDGRAAALVFESEEQRHLLILVRKGDDWRTVGLGSGPAEPRLARRQTTTARGSPLVAVHRMQAYGAAHAGAAAQAWSVVSGVAPQDASAVVVASEADRVEAPVGEHGLFLALLEAPVDGPLTGAVRTRDGHLVAVRLEPGRPGTTGAS